MSTNTSAVPACFRGGDVQTNLNLAPLLFGLLFTYFLFGTLTLQTYLYYLEYRKSDSIWLQGLVYGMLLCELLHTGFGTQIVFEQLISGFGDPNIAKGLLGPTSIVVPILDGFISIVVQGFFVWRIWALSRGARWVKIMCAVITLLSILQFIAVIIAETSIAKFATSSHARPVDAIYFQNLTSQMIALWSASSLACDVLIALTMTYLLIKFKNETNYRKTNDLLSKILRLTIQTGLATAICPIVQTPLFLIFNTTALGTTTALVVGKIYSNSLLANLNARKAPVEERPHGLTSLKWAPRPSAHATSTGLSDGTTAYNSRLEITTDRSEPDLLKAVDVDYSTDSRHIHSKHDMDA